MPNEAAGSLIQVKDGDFKSLNLVLREMYNRLDKLGGARGVWQHRSYIDLNQHQIINMTDPIKPQDGVNLRTLTAAIAAIPPSSTGYYEPVTNGDPAAPEILFHDGDVVMHFIP